MFIQTVTPTKNLLLLLANVEFRKLIMVEILCKCIVRIKHSSHHSPKPELFLSVSQHEAGLIKYSSLHFSPIFTGLTILLILLNPVKYLCSYFCIVDIAE